MKQNNKTKATSQTKQITSNCNAMRSFCTLAHRRFVVVTSVVRMHTGSASHRQAKFTAVPLRRKPGDCSARRGTRAGQHDRTHASRGSASQHSAGVGGKLARRQVQANVGQRQLFRVRQRHQRHFMTRFAATRFGTGRRCRFARCAWGGCGFGRFGRRALCTHVAASATLEATLANLSRAHSSYARQHSRASRLFGFCGQNCEATQKVSFEQRLERLKARFFLILNIIEWK